MSEENIEQITPDEDGIKPVTDDSSKVEFSEAQQKKVQSIIDSTFKRAKEDNKAEIEALTADFDSKLKALEKAKAEVKGKEVSDSEKDVINQLQVSIKEKEAALASAEQNALETQKNILLMNEISKQQVVNSGEVMALVKEQIGMDEDGVPFIKDGEGYKVNMNGDKMGITEFIKGWLAERPHHLQGTGGGAGSQKAIGGNGKGKYDLNDPKTYHNMPRDDFDKLMAEGIDINNLFGNEDVNMRFKNSKNPFTEARQRKFKQ